MSFLTVFRGLATPDHLVVQSTPLGSPPPDTTHIYRPNFDAFRRWARNHRDHQIAALDAIRGQSIGQICLPTGTGKTRVQVSVHVEDMIAMLQRNEYGTFVTSAHRLALCTQLLEELIAVAVNAGIPFDILFVGSSRFPDDTVHAKFKDQGFNRYVNEATSTTSGEDIRKAVFRSHARKRHTLAVSTYHSFDRLNVLDRIDVATYDEAHVTVCDDFLGNIKLVRPKVGRNFFFTATRRVQGDTEGMNNEALFGKVLYEVPPRQMVDEGEIVPPKIHVIRTEDEGDYNNHSMLVRTVVTGFEQHRTLVKHVSANPEIIGAKLLITTTGNMEMAELHDDAAFQEYCLRKGIKVFSYSSERGSFYNFQPKSRDETMRIMRDMGDDEDGILLHIDILTEGIDLPSITGVMPFRELNTLKLLQTIGRAARLLKDDRSRLYSGELAPRNWQGYIKPCCWVILPEFFKSLGNANAMKNAIRTIINAYEVPVEEYSTIDRYKAQLVNDNDRITDHDDSRRKDRETNLIHLIEEVMMENVWTTTEKKPIDLIQEFFGG